jgi:hypothetical protein
MPTLLTQRKAASRGPIGEVPVEPPESLARGTLSEGFPRNLGDLLVSSVQAEGLLGRGRPETDGTGAEESYDPVVPRKVGNRHGWNPLEGRGNPTGRPD